MSTLDLECKDVALVEVLPDQHTEVPPVFYRVLRSDLWVTRPVCGCPGVRVFSVVSGPVDGPGRVPDTGRVPESVGRPTGC